jgi:hypothetical protein
VALGVILRDTLGSEATRIPQCNQPKTGSPTKIALPPEIGLHRTDAAPVRACAVEYVAAERTISSTVSS